MINEILVCIHKLMSPRRQSNCFELIIALSPSHAQDNLSYPIDSREHVQQANAKLFTENAGFQSALPKK
jgi:hypothetical protein